MIESIKSQKISKSKKLVEYLELDHWKKQNENHWLAFDGKMSGDDSDSFV